VAGILCKKYAAPQKTKPSGPAKAATAVIASSKIVHAFVFNVSADRIAFGGLALAWSWYSAIVLIVVCFVWVEQPRRRKAERFTSDEPMLIEAD
jgi:cellulose synthase (UDP-forming)